MGDLINRQALISELEKTPIRLAADKSKMFQMIENAPTIDAVEVVRCGECEYKRELEGHLVCGDSMRAGMGADVFEIPTYYFNKIVPDDFCSRGRRKENG